MSSNSAQGDGAFPAGCEAAPEREIVRTAMALGGGKTPYRADSLLSLRGLAAFFVVCGHLQVGPVVAAVTGISVVAAFAVSGSYAVFIFFCISGYLMAKILDRDYGPGSLARFYWNRATRILPVYYLSVLLTAAMLPHAVSLRDWPALLLINNYFSSPLANAPLWSLATECQFYLVAPIVALATRRWRATPLLLLATGLGIKFFYWFGFDLLPERKDLVYMGLEANVMYFMTGWCAYLYRERLPALQPMAGIALLCAILAALWLFHFYNIENTPAGLYASFLWMVVFPLIMCVAAIIVLPGVDDGGLALQRMRPPLAAAFYFLGVTSYSAYVLHTPMYGVLSRLPALLVVVAVYVLAVVVFLAFEKPLFRLRAFPQARAASSAARRS